MSGGAKGSAEPKLSSAEYHRRAAELLQAAEGAKPPMGVALLGSFTMDFLRPFLVVEADRLGLRLDPWVAPFGQLEQPVADPQSRLYQPAAPAVVIAFRPEDVDPDAMIRPYAPGSAGPAAALREVTDRLVRAVESIRTRSSAPILVANFAQVATPPLGPFDANVTDSVTLAFAAANIELARRLAPFPNTAVWDLAGLVRHHGTAIWTDARLWALARQPIAPALQPAVATHLARTLSAMVFPPAKCLVLDLDNTIWGGVIGDDGLAGIKLGDDYPGSAFKEFQRRALALSDRGILLAVVSKNDHDVAKEAFDRHPEMLIRWKDLAAVRINWQPKSGNLREIAKELNIGSDHLVFFDDNPVERAEVRANAPEVLVVDVPTDPLRYTQVLDAVHWFDQVSLSAEDRSRAEMYRQQNERTILERSAPDIETFLASLEMTATVGEVDDATVARVAQLIGKTNQFNVATRRHTDADIARMAADASTVVAWLRVSDRFGDQGLVAVGILRKEGDAGIIDTLLMSCRVMNRRVEHALLAFLTEHARRLGCRTLVGEYLPTKKNGMVRDLYSSLGFAPVDAEGRLFQLDVTDETFVWPTVIQRRQATASATSG